MAGPWPLAWRRLRFSSALNKTLCISAKASAKVSASAFFNPESAFSIEVVFIIKFLFFRVRARGGFPRPWLSTIPPPLQGAREKALFFLRPKCPLYYLFHVKQIFPGGIEGRARKLLYKEARKSQKQFPSISQKQFPSISPLTEPKQTIIRRSDFGPRAHKKNQNREFKVSQLPIRIQGFTTSDANWHFHNFRCVPRTLSCGLCYAVALSQTHSPWRPTWTIMKNKKTRRFA